MANKAICVAGYEKHFSDSSINMSKSAFGVIC